MKKRIQSVNERMKRQYHAEVRRFKAWCEKEGVQYATFSDSDKDYICALSSYEYEIGDRRYQIETDNESYFLEEEVWEKYSEEWQ